MKDFLLKYFDKNIVDIVLNSKKDRNTIFNYLYKNKKDLYLKRKYEKIKLHL